MPLIDFFIKPGIFSDLTSREVGKLRYWKDCDHIRFFNGRVQKLGGWQKIIAQKLLGKARAAIDWVSSRQEQFIAIGTHRKLYVIFGGVAYDITPIRASGTLGANPFSTTAGSNIITVTHNTHGCNLGDHVRFSNCAPLLPNRGYFGGGSTGSLSNEIDGIRFDTEAAINPSATLAVARSFLAGVNSFTRGYFGGGNAGTYSNEIDGIQFDTEAAINPSATLAVARHGLAGVNSSIRGYFGGGWTGSSSNEIDGIRFDTEAAINPMATLVVARSVLASVDSSIRGYFGGGIAGISINEIDGIQFDTEAAINPSAALAVARYGLAGVNSSTRGYFGGGYAGSFSNEIDGIQFDTEVAINPSATLAVAREQLAGVNSSTRGYFGGGFTGSLSNEIDGIQFDTEAAINPSVALAVARQYLAGVQPLGVIDDGLLLNGEYVVSSIIDTNSYTITYSVLIPVTTTGGGSSVQFSYDIHIGYEYPIAGLGWGAGKWNEDTWGTSRTASSIRLNSRIWSLANWGEDLIASPYNGPIYVWRSSLGVHQRATLITQAPSTSRAIAVVPDYRQIIALGAHDGVDDDPLLIRWCSQEDYTSWAPTLSNTAGDARLEYGNEIVAFFAMVSGNIIFTDTYLYSMTPVGLPDIYSITPIGANHNICGPRAAVVFKGTCYWMTDNGFYMYDGAINKLPCSVYKHVYDNINFSMLRHVCATVNNKYGEIWWFYPSSDSEELNRYVVFNVLEQCWYYGTLDRTVAVGDSKIFNNMYAVSSDGFLYEHDGVIDADGGPLSAFIESGAIELPEAGEDLLHIYKFIPDFLEINGEMSFTLIGKKYPQDSAVQINGPFVLGSNTRFVSPRIRCRQIALKFSSDSLGTFWSFSSLRIGARKHGSR